MSIEYSIILLLLFHYFADFICQTEWQAMNKSRSYKALTDHVVIYTFLMMVLSSAFFGPAGVLIGGVNGILHLPIDWVTSRINTHYYRTQQRSKFFNMIGLDQLIHTSLLIYTYKVFVNG
jgi:succinate dehydrogenase/fumarate reductase cytochrome b subunit